MDKQVIQCTCGFELLVIPDLAEMRNAIENHAKDKHTKDPKRDRVVLNLSQKTLLKASEFFKEARANHADITQLGEQDCWVNDATRKDIENTLTLYGEENVFGVEVWSFKKFRGKELIGICNFGVSYLFTTANEKKVDRVIDEYQKQNDGNFNAKATWKIVNTLDRLAIHTCTWV